MFGISLKATRALPITALIWSLLLGTIAHAQMLEVRDRAGDLIVKASLPTSNEWCLQWNHSVTGGKVMDCFSITDGQLFLEKSYLHDFAAGLGEVLGRGRLVGAADHGYWIMDIHEHMPSDKLILRVGSLAVDHRLILGDRIIRLSPLAVGRRVSISASTDPEEDLAAPSTAKTVSNSS